MEEKHFNKMNEDYQDWLINGENSIGKEKTADKMLGYVKDNDVGYGVIRYNKDDKCFIRFIMDTEEVETNKISSDGSVWILDINMDLLQAINKKCKEMNWI